jgi:hypothetical protein
MSTPSVDGGEAQAAFSLDQNALIVSKNGTPVPGLEGDAQENLAAGAILIWQASRHTWVLTQLDVG